MNTEELSLEELCQLFSYTSKGRPLEAAELLGLTVDTLEGWALRGIGPESFSPPGTRRIWYAELGLLRWLARCRPRSPHCHR